MKVLLINPFFSGFEEKETSFIQRALNSKYPPLGLALIASQLLKNGHDIDIIDAEALELSDKEVIEKVKKFKPEIIGVTTTTWTFKAVVKTARAIKDKFPRIKIVLGGPHVTVFPKESLKEKCIDYGVMGEGELVFSNLVDALESGKKLKLVKGIVYRKGSKVIVNSPAEFIQDINNVVPAWHLLPIDHYKDVMARHRRLVTMFTSRGCPFNCSYCDSKARFGRKIRYRSSDSILKEIDLLYNKYRIREICFYDDTFTVNKKRVKELCEKLIGKNYNLIWECRTRVDCVDEELLKYMAKAGCYRIRFGVESGNQEILKRINKNIKLKQIIDVFKWSKKYNIETIAYFMLGCPGETKETMEETIRFSLKLDPDYVLFSPVRLLNQGSDMFRWAAENNYIDKDYWRKYINGEELDSMPVLETEELNKEDVLKAVSKGYKSFYLRPSFIFKSLRHLRSIGAIRTHALFFFSFLFDKGEG